MSNPQQTRRLDAANAMLCAFAPDSRIRFEPKRGFVVAWRTARGRDIERRWSTTPGTDLGPPWHRKWPHGGTACLALAQLVRWLQGRAVCGSSTWVYWSGEPVWLGERAAMIAAVERLLAAGWPRDARCVLCGREGPTDWWSLDGVSGPCCATRRGCREHP